MIAETMDEVAAVLGALRAERDELRTENVWLKEQIREALRVSGHRRRGFILRMALERIGEAHR